MINRFNCIDLNLIMIKRTAAVAFLFLAGVLFLAHAVVPHHHHGNLICFAKSHCANDGTEENHGPVPDNHHHDGDDGFCHCVLKAPVIVSTNQPAAGLKTFDKKCTQPGDDKVQNSLTAEVAWATEAGLWSSLSSPPIWFIYPSLSLISVGLRAPPAV